MRVLNLAGHLGAEVIANTVVVLPGDTTVNFIYEMSGLRSFASEFKSAHQLEFADRKVAVLPLERIHASKKAAGRPKDLAQLPLLEQTIRLRARALRKKT